MQISTRKAKWYRGSRVHSYPPGQREPSNRSTVPPSECPTRTLPGKLVAPFPSRLESQESIAVSEGPEEMKPPHCRKAPQGRFAKCDPKRLPRAGCRRDSRLQWTAQRPL